MKLCDYQTINGVPWSVLKFKLQDSKFDHLTFAVSYFTGDLISENIEITK